MNRNLNESLARHALRNFIFLGVSTGLVLWVILTLESPQTVSDELLLFLLVVAIGIGIGALAGWVCRKILLSMGK